MKTTAPTSAELLNCPFCGGGVKLELCNETIDQLYGHRKWWGVKCRNTVNRGGTCAIEQVPSASEQAAVERWNRRAAMQTAEPAQDDPRLEDLRYIVERLARSLSKADPNSGEPTGALVYLRRVGLTGSPLRGAAPDRAPSIDNIDASQTLQREPSIDSAGDAKWQRLLKAARTYANNYCQDEAEREPDPDMRICGDDQHEEAVELFAAIAALQPEGSGHGQA